MSVTVTLTREDMQRAYELLLARAVALEAAEAYMAPYGLGALNTSDYRRPANTIRAALDD